ncbi:hypothetical protein BASA81_004073 [Batrachochytrium salamandrivorans]|nr:hypothetical protein BASA81_004073 [Batrachochytrium salamandrivorans]
MNSEEVLECDVLVVGGGSGGLACAQATSKVVGSVIICDYVRPSDTKQTVWGFGGTCVNVGCVPKKLFHRAGYFGQSLRDGELTAFGFNSASMPKVGNWTDIVTTVQNHVKMLNFTYRVKLPENCKYVKARAQFNGNNLVSLIKPNGEVVKVKVNKAIVISVGGRPIIPQIPGSELGISSDDVFSLKQTPNKTLVVGSSYIGLETASFLNAIGLDTTLLVRSRPLRSQGFDQDSADKTFELMQQGTGLKVRRGVELTKLEPGIVAHFTDGSWEKFDTVLFATGRAPEVKRLGVLPSNVKVNQDSGKIMVDSKTFLASAGSKTFPAVYSIGDCTETGALELTPVAVRQGDLVAQHIAGLKLGDKLLNSLRFAPSTVFALPSEYSRAGLSESEAVQQFGEKDVECYLRAWEPLETGAAHANAENMRCFVKFVCIKSQQDRVVGLHLVTPNSSEVIHGLALSLALGATKDDFDARVLGIHPTDAEGLCDVTVTKSSGESFNVAGGCGGGRCG